MSPTGPMIDDKRETSYSRSPSTQQAWPMWVMGSVLKVQSSPLALFRKNTRPHIDQYYVGKCDKPLRMRVRIEIL